MGIFWPYMHVESSGHPDFWHVVIGSGKNIELYIWGVFMGKYCITLLLASQIEHWPYLSCRAMLAARESGK